MTIDANIIIAYLSGEESIVRAVVEWRKNGQPMFLSAIVEAEVLSFSSWTSEEKSKTTLFLEENFIFVPFDRQIARIAADLRRVAKIKLPDAAIAATAFYTHTPVVTRNTRDFKKIADIEIITM